MRLCLVILVGCAQQPTSGVFPSNATSVDVHETGGLIPAPAAGSTCTPGDDSYTYVLATHLLSWHECSSPTVGGVYAFVVGQATLDDGTDAQLVDALHALEAPPQPCGSDVSSTLVFATPGGDMTNNAAECLVGYNDMMSVFYTAAP